MKKQKDNMQVSKLFVITRKDLPPGYQLTQSTHAAIDFQHKYPGISKQWQNNSNYLVCLSANNESDLIKYISKAKERNIKFCAFYEPDINNQLTAVAFEPTSESKKLCSNLSLALKEYNEYFSNTK